MKIALIGASGFVGSAILKEALERGHTVTAIVRNPEKITVSGAALKVFKGDVRNADEVAALVKGNDIVISAYNAGWTNPDLYNEFLQGSQAIHEGVKKAGVMRYLVIGGAGSLFVAPGLQAVDTAEFPAEWKPGALAARDYLNILKKETVLDWSFLSPAFELAPGVRKGAYRTGSENPVFDENGKSAISVEDLAVAVVDEAEKNAFSRQRFTVAY